MDRYELVWIRSFDNQFFTIYVNGKKELKEQLNYLIDEFQLNLNDNDRFDNIQVIKILKNEKRIILSKYEVYEELK